MDPMDLHMPLFLRHEDEEQAVPPWSTPHGFDQQANQQQQQEQAQSAPVEIKVAGMTSKIKQSQQPAFVGQSEPQAVVTLQLDQNAIVTSPGQATSIDVTQAMSFKTEVQSSSITAICGNNFVGSEAAQKNAHENRLKMMELAQKFPTTWGHRGENN